MDDQRSPLQNLLRSPKFFIAAGIIIIIIVIVILLPNPASKIPESTALSIRVTNFSNIFPNLDTTTRAALEESLYAQVINDATPSESTTAIIRKDSLVTVDYNNYHTGDFIVDIKSLGLSYLVSFHHGTFANHEIESTAFATFYCPKEDQLIYPVFACSANINYSRPTVYDLEEAERAESSITND